MRALDRDGRCYVRADNAARVIFAPPEEAALLRPPNSHQQASVSAIDTSAMSRQSGIGANTGRGDACSSVRRGTPLAQWHRRQRQQAASTPSQHTRRQHTQPAQADSTLSQHKARPQAGSTGQATVRPSSPHHQRTPSQSSASATAQPPLSALQHCNTAPCNTATLQHCTPRSFHPYTNQSNSQYLGAAAST